MKSTPELGPATNLLDAQHALEPRPLAGVEAKAYYVPRGDGVEAFLDDLRTATASPHKYLFTGHWGCGKTTELLRLVELLRDRYFPVYFDVEQAIGLADINYQDVVLSLGLQIYTAAHDHGLKLPVKFKTAMLRWFRTTLWEEEKLVGGRASAEAKADAYFFKLSARLGSEAATRKTVRTQVDSNLSDLLRHVDDLIEVVNRKSGRHTLVVVDGLDKVHDEALVRKLYVEGVGNLLAPQCKAIYTVPFSLFQSVELGQIFQRFSDAFPLPNIRLRSRMGEPNAEGEAMLRQVILRRVRVELIAPDALGRLVESSGGVMRELVATASNAFQSARLLGHGRVDLPHVERAVTNRAGVMFGWLAPDHFRELEYVRRHKRHSNSAGARELINGLAILGYLDPDRARWWDIHPALVAQLMERSDEIGDRPLV